MSHVGVSFTAYMHGTAKQHKSCVLRLASGGALVHVHKAVFTTILTDANDHLLYPVVGYRRLLSTFTAKSIIVPSVLAEFMRPSTPLCSQADDHHACVLACKRRITITLDS